MNSLSNDNKHFNLSIRLSRRFSKLCFLNFFYFSLYTCFQQHGSNNKKKQSLNFKIFNNEKKLKFSYFLTIQYSVCSAHRVHTSLYISSDCQKSMFISNTDENKLF